MRRRDYSTVADLRMMQELTQRTWSLESNWHIGDLAWQRNAVPDTDSSWRTSLWQTGAETIAWAWAELPGHLSLVVDPSFPDLAAEVIAWFEEICPARELTCTVLETESQLTTALAAAKYRPDPSAPFFTHHHRSLSDIAPPSLPPGFNIHQVQPGQAERRSQGHLLAWSEFGSKLTATSYRDVMTAWPYRHELDWVVEDEAGRFVATSLGWIDEQNKVGLLEPVGCAPEHRRRGLATAVNLATLTALREAGATQAVVCPRGDPGYPVAAKLYQSIGFQPGLKTITYKKSRADTFGQTSGN